VIDIARLADAAGHLARLMGEAEAVLVRPDRLLFGCGGVSALLAAWDRYLAGESAAA